MLPEIIDDAPQVKGDVSVRVYAPDGSPHQSPLSIFKDQDAAKAYEVNGNEVELRSNLVVNNGRQIIANLIGGKDFNTSTPNSDWIISYVRWGTYDEAPKFGDTTLSPQPLAGSFVGGENTILYDGVNSRKLITAVDWPQPYIVRFEFSLGPDEANGMTIREMGLYSGNDTLFARKTCVPIAKSSSFALTFLWRVRAILTFWIGVAAAIIGPMISGGVWTT